MINEHIAQWTSHQKHLHSLCGLLDGFAARLPQVGIEDCADIVRRLNVALLAAHAYEEAALFPALEARSSQVTGVLSLFRGHHLEDRQEAATIARLMIEANGAQPGDAFGQLSIRLPLFTRALRRNLQFEEAICRALFASLRPEGESKEAPRRLAS